MGIRSINIVILLALVISCKENGTTIPIEDVQQLQVAAIDKTNMIEVVTWNIENFPKSDLADEYLAQLINGIQADIYLFQEIQSNSKFSTMMENLGNYNYFINNSSSNLEYGVVYKKNVVSLKSTSQILTDSSYYFANRSPLLAIMEWNNNGVLKDLSLIDVHYKCCSDGEERRQRASELLHDYLSNQDLNGNFIVVGDWNDAIEEPQSTNVFQVFIEDNANFQFIDMEIANSDSENWSWQGWNSSYPAIHFDHILINQNLFDEYYNDSSVDVIKVEEYFENGSLDYEDYLSDHRPVYFQFNP